MSTEHLPDLHHTRHRAWLSIVVVALLVSGGVVADTGARAPVVEIPGVPASHATPEVEAKYVDAAEQRDRGREIAADRQAQVEREAAEAEAKAAEEVALEAEREAAEAKKASEEKAEPASGGGSADPAAKKAEKKDDPNVGPARLGATGGKVVTVQKRLQAHGWNLYADGDFGGGTDAALRQFQAAYGLSADGVAGPSTLAALNRAPAAKKSGGGSSGGSSSGSSSGGSGSTAPAAKAPATKPAAPSAPSGGVVQQTNWYRAQAGCGPVSPSGSLSAAAQGHVNDMAANGYFSHTSQDGRTFDQRIRAAGYSAPGGENLARGQTSVSQVMKEWMASAGHRANIVNCSFRTIGVGQVGVYWAQEFGY